MGPSADAAPTPAPSSSATPPAAKGRPPTVTFGIGAATAKGLDPSRDHLNYLVDPGSSVGDHIVLVNLGVTPLSLAVYTAEAFNGSGGSIAYRTRADPGREARNWLAFGTAGPTMTVVVLPRSSRVVPVEVHVPTNATPGDHVVGVMASVTSRVRSTSGENPRLEQRLALRAFFRVSGLLKPQLTIAGLKATYDGSWNPAASGTATVSYTVRNTGNVDLGGNQAVKISGLFGSVGSITTTPQVPLLLPGGSYPVRVIVHHVWPELFMHAKVTVTPLGASGAVNPVVKPFSAETSFWAVPWALLVLIVLVVGLVVGWRRWRAAHPPSARHRPAQGSATTPVPAGKV